MWAGRCGPVSLPLVTQAPAAQPGDGCAMQEKKAEEIPPRMHRYAHSNISAPSEVWESRLVGVEQFFTLSMSIKARCENNDWNGPSKHEQAHLLMPSANWTVVAW